MQEWLIADLRRYRLQLAAREESGGAIMINPTTGRNYRDCMALLVQLLRIAWRWRRIQDRTEDASVLTLD